MIDWTSLPNDVVAAGVIAALGLVLRHLNSRYAPKIDMFKSVAANATKITSRILLPILFSIVGLWFCIHMLLDAVHDPAPVTRVAVLEIVVWAWLAGFVFLTIAFPHVFTRRARRDE